MIGERKAADPDKRAERRDSGTLEQAWQETTRSGLGSAADEVTDGASSDTVSTASVSVHQQRERLGIGAFRFRNSELHTKSVYLLLI